MNYAFYGTGKVVCFCVVCAIDEVLSHEVLHARQLRHIMVKRRVDNIVDEEVVQVEGAVAQGRAGF